LYFFFSRHFRIYSVVSIFSEAEPSLQEKGTGYF
jgi:hypothetical protein